MIPLKSFFFLVIASVRENIGGMFHFIILLTILCKIMFSERLETSSNV